MKKRIISLLLACAMISMLVPAAFAQEYQNTIEWETSIPGWATTPTEITYETDTVDGVEKTVLKWLFSNQDSTLSYPLGRLEAGTYTMSVYIKSPGNMGNTLFGITTDKGNGGMPRFNENYVRVSRDVTVTAENATSEQNFLIFTQWGDCAYAYIAEASIKKKNDDGTYGPELIRDEPIIGYDNFWSISNAYNYEVVAEYINGELKNVLKVTYKNGDGSTMAADIKNNTLEAGNYRISITFKCPNNGGNTRVGVTLDSNGGYPDNSPDTTLAGWTSNYTTVTKDITITSDKAYAKQRLYIKTGWGDDNCDLYLADIKLQRVYDDETLGENRIVNPDFTVSEIPSNVVPVRAVSKWSKYHGSPAFTEQDNFTVRNVTAKDGTETRALVGYKAANNAGIKSIVQFVPTEAGKTYRVTYDYKQTGAVQNFGTRMNSATQGDFYETYVAAAYQGATDWQTATCDYVMGDADAIDNFLAFSLEGQTFEGEQLVYIDNVRFQEVIDENTLGANLIVNGDFEAKSYNASLMFDIYDDTNSSVTGGEGFGSIPDFSLEDLGYKMVAEATVVNDENDAIKPVLIVAVYDNGVLSGLETVESSIAGGATEKWYGVVDLPNSVGSGKVVAKAFVWDSLSSLKPISTVEQVEEVEE